MRRAALSVTIAVACVAAPASARPPGAAPPAPAPLVDAKRPPRSLPAIARRDVDEGPVVVTMVQPGSGEVVVAVSWPLVTVDHHRARTAPARAAFPVTEAARARGVSRDVRVERSVLLVVYSAPASELAFVLFSIAAGLSAPPSDGLDVARLAEQRAAYEQAISTPPGKLAAAALRTTAPPSVEPLSLETERRRPVHTLPDVRPSVVVVGDVETAHVVELVDRHFAPMSTRRARPMFVPPASKRVTADGPSGAAVLADFDLFDPDPAVDLSLFAVARRTGAERVRFSDATHAQRGLLMLASDARRAETVLVRALDDVAKSGPTPDEITAFRAASEAEALSRGLVDWAVKLSHVELATGDARLAGRELSRVWEVDAERVKRALSGPLSEKHRTVVTLGAPR